MRATLCLLALLVATLAHADLHAWTRRVGTGAEDEARFVVTSASGHVFVALSSDRRVTLAKLEPRNGRVLWISYVGNGDPAALKVDSNGSLLVASNSVDQAGKSHASVQLVDGRSGAVRWGQHGIGGIEIDASKVVALSDLRPDGSFTIGGTQDGEAVLATYDTQLGTLRSQVTVPGVRVTSLSDKFFTSDGLGQSWFGMLNLAGRPAFIEPIAIPNYAGARYENPRVTRLNGSQIWLAGDVRKTSLGEVYAISYNIYKRTAEYVTTYKSSFDNYLVDVRKPIYVSVGVHIFPTLIKAIDPRGNVQSVYSQFVYGSWAGPNDWAAPTAFRQTKFSPLGWSVGSVFLKGRGWDLAVPRRSGTSTHIPFAIDAGLNADDELADIDDLTYEPYAFMTSRRFGKSEARLIKLQSPKKFGSKTVVGGFNCELALWLWNVAPDSGYDLEVSVPNGSPLRVPRRVRIEGGRAYASILVHTEPVRVPTDVPVTITSGQGLKLTANVRIWPASLAVLSVAPSMKGGTTSTATVFLNGRAPQEGALVRLTTSSDLLRLPPTVVVPGGADRATFSIVNSLPSAVTTVTVTATYNATVLSKPTLVLP